MSGLPGLTRISRSLLYYWNYKEVEIEGNKKKFIKGGRLHLYPTGMRIYRKSKGIKEPEIVHGIYKYRKEIIGDCKPYYRENIIILDDLSKELNNIVYEQYNKKLDKFESMFWNV